MTDLPTGTVTFMFTDIVDSTRLLSELGDRYETAQDEHADILTGLFAEADGVVVRTEGDGFFVAFPDPVKAIEAAVSAQVRLAAHEWSSEVPLQVRIGLHTGRGERGGGDYVGIDVNRAARIAGSASGGQVLLSEATKALVEHALPESASLRDLGEHRFKGIGHAEHLYDLVIEGLAADFPSIDSLDAGVSNLPVQLTSFVGREREVGELVSLLERTRILTLTGPGGIGKTRLAIEVAGACLPTFRNGAVFVDLSSIHDPDVVPSEILSCMNLTPHDGRPALERLIEQFRDTETLLVLDNFEQVVDAAPVVEELVSVAPHVKVIVTSRVSLSLRGEQEFPVLPFALPAKDQGVGESPAVRLFADRARSIDPHFQITEENEVAVVEIVARVDGLPLAIELAATRVKMLSPIQMLDHFDDRLSLLSKGQRTLPERQRTIRAVIEWSYELLQVSEQSLFARLAVFNGGWTMEAADMVCALSDLGLDALDGLETLVDKSLVRHETGADGHRPRFSMLQTIRDFAAEKLHASPDAAAVARRHAEYFHDFALDAEPHLLGEDQVTWLIRCDLEHDNIRGALRWAIAADEAEMAQETTGALWRFWQQRGHFDEASRWFDQVLSMPSGSRPTGARAKALRGAGGIAWWRTDIDATSRFYNEALEIERKIGNPKALAEALYDWAHAAVATGDFEGSIEALEESLAMFTRLGDEDGIARVQYALAGRDLMAGRWEAAAARNQGAVQTWRRLGNRFQLTQALSGLATSYARDGRTAEARSAAAEYVDLVVEAESPVGVVFSMMLFALIALMENRFEDAVRLGTAYATLRDQTGGGAPPGLLALLVGDPIEHARVNLSEEAAELAQESGQSMTLDDALSTARQEAAR